MHVRVCPDCGEEFRSEIVRCSDCGALLVDHRGDETVGDVTGEMGGPELASEVPAESPEDFLPVFTATGSAELREAAGRLAAAGVRFRATGNSTALGLLAHADDFAAATQALAGLEGAVVLGPQTDADATACPACGTALPAGAEVCPECQLVVGGDAGPSSRGGLRDDE
jgi:hypothetical protein